MPNEGPRCSKGVWDSLRMKYFPCSRKGSVERDGKWYCKQHDPEAVARRNAERQAKYDARWDAERKKLDRRVAELRACAGVPDGQLKPGIVAKMIEVLREVRRNGYFPMSREEPCDSVRDILDELEAKCSDD